MLFYKYTVKLVIALISTSGVPDFQYLYINKKCSSGGMILLRRHPCIICYRQCWGLGVLDQVFEIFNFYTSTESGHQAEQLLLRRHSCICYSVAGLLEFHIRCSRSSIFICQQRVLTRPNNLAKTSFLYLLQCSWALGVPHQVFQIFKFILSAENAHHVEHFLLLHHFCISFSLAGLLRFCARCSSFQNKLQPMCWPYLIPIQQKKNHSNPSSTF